MLTSWNIVAVALHRWTHPYIDITMSTLLVFLVSMFLVYSRDKPTPNPFALIRDLPVRDARPRTWFDYVGDAAVHWLPAIYVLLFLPYKTEYTPLKTTLTFVGIVLFAAALEAHTTYDIDTRLEERAVYTAGIAALVIRAGFAI
ncbi:hypothetical protein FOA52_004171 [Chlamydomonas sp. UWO 241]|nr:hypothetical protein FOA52_004171 [Chlamydomonas sp. UWO 241]